MKIQAKINRSIIIEFFILTAGSVITAAGVYFFKMPNHFSMGGFSGLSILLAELFSINTSLLVTVLNLLSLAVGFLFLGWGVGGKTIYCTLLYTGMVNVFEWIYPIDAGTTLTGEVVLELVAASLLGAVGAGLLFKCGGSTGGTDIIALVLRKFTSADISFCMMIADGLIVAASFFVFDVKTGICSIIGMLIKTSLVQTVVDSLNRRKSLIIITTAPHEIVTYITETLHRSATIWDAQGAFTDTDRAVIFSAMTTYQAAKLRDFAKTVDEHAFVTINKTSEIYGKGFLPFGRN
ncbi:MAG: YitT family protein [Clostridiales bacterium]|nr:MAG: YitT family protein [Clostridiales bacterium]